MAWKWGKVPGQKLVDAVDGMVGDTFEHMTEIEFRVDAVQFGRAQQSIDRSRAFSSGIRACEEIVLPFMQTFT